MQKQSLVLALLLSFICASAASAGKARYIDVSQQGHGLWREKRTFHLKGHRDVVDQAVRALAAVNGPRVQIKQTVRSRLFGSRSERVHYKVTLKEPTLAARRQIDMILRPFEDPDRIGGF